MEAEGEVPPFEMDLESSPKLYSRVCNLPYFSFVQFLSGNLHVSRDSIFYSCSFAFCRRTLLPFMNSSRKEYFRLLLSNLPIKPFQEFS